MRYRHFARPGRRHERAFGHGGLRLVLLKLLADRPSHGYELIKEIEGRLNGRYSPSPGTVYPALAMLEDQGLVTQNEIEDGRKLYTITAAGDRELEVNKEIVDGLFQRMNENSGRAERAPQIVRATENLRVALHLRVSNGVLSPEQIDAIAAALDDAARTIERA